MLPSTLKYLYSVEPVIIHFSAKQPCTNDTVCNDAGSIAHSIICRRLFRGKMHSDCFIGIEILRVTWQHGEKVGYRYPRELEKSTRIPSIFKDKSTGSCICLRSLIHMSHVNKVQPIRVNSFCFAHCFPIVHCFPTPHNPPPHMCLRNAYEG
jgi:hypothetical protein